MLNRSVFFLKRRKYSKIYLSKVKANRNPLFIRREEKRKEVSTFVRDIGFHFYFNYSISVVRAFIEFANQLVLIWEKVSSWDRIRGILIVSLSGNSQVKSVESPLPRSKFSTNKPLCSPISDIRDSYFSQFSNQCVCLTAAPVQNMFV